MKRTTNLSCADGRTITTMTTASEIGYWQLMFRGIRLIAGWISGLFERALIHGMWNWLSDEFARHEALDQRVDRVAMSARMHGILSRLPLHCRRNSMRSMIDWPKYKGFASCLWGAEVLIHRLGEFQIKVRSDNLTTVSAVSRRRLMLRGVVQGIAWHIQHFPNNVHLASFRKWLSNEFVKHEALGQRPTRITMNAQTYSLVRKMGWETVQANDDKESRDRGLIARLWGAEVWVRRNAGNRIMVESLSDAGIAIDG